ncbi:class F sortase [Kocuria marina]|uniref:class F sortase n=1 Tax=Kocuria marina TaxID=223184 RepID=UPI0030B86630
MVLGHVNATGGGPGVFADLPVLTPGDEIRVQRADGTQAQFRVTHAECYAKDAFPHGARLREHGGPATAAHRVRPLRPRHRHLRRESRGLRDPRHQGNHPAVPEVQPGRGAQSPTTSRSCSLIRSSRAAASSRGTAPPSGTGRTTSR